MNIGIIASQKGNIPDPFIPPRVTLPKYPDGGWYYPEAGNPVITSIEPGSIIEVTSDMPYGRIVGLKGTAERPIIITNVGGKWRFHADGAAYGLSLGECEHVIVDGGGTPGIEKGLVFGPEASEPYSAQCLGIRGTDWVVRNCEITHGEVGLFSNPATGPNQYNVKVHDNWIHDMLHPGATCEAIYLGSTAINTIEGTRFENLEIYNNLIEDIGGDGIQVACARNYHIHDNVIDNYGVSQLSSHQTGILMGGQTYGICENNIVKNGTGSGMQVFGYSNHIIRNNQILNTSVDENQDAIYIRKTDTADGDKLKVDVINNTISNAGGPAIARNGIRNATSSLAGLPGNWSGNTIINTTATAYVTNIGDVITP